MHADHANAGEGYGPPSCVVVEDLPNGGALVHIPENWPVRLRFLAAFPRRIPVAPWRFFVPGRTAARRCARFAAEVAADLARERRRLAWQRSETEWGA